MCYYSNTSLVCVLGMGDYVIEEITLSDSDDEKEIEILSDYHSSNPIPKRQNNIFKLLPIDVNFVKKEKTDPCTVYTVPDDDEPPVKKVKKTVPYDSSSTSSDLNRIRNAPSYSTSPPPSLVLPTSISRHQTGISYQTSPISDARLRQILNQHQTLIPQSTKIKCEFSSTSLCQTPQEEITIHTPETNGVISKTTIDNCDIDSENCELQNNSENSQFQIGSENCEIKTEPTLEPVNELCIRKHSKLPRRNLFEKFKDLDIDLSIYKRRSGYVETVEQLVPFPLRYCPVLPRDSDAREFDESIMATITSEVNATIKSIAAFTSQKFRPPRELISKLFHWTIDSASESELNLRLNVMRQIHRLHGFPKSEPLFLYLEKAYNRDSFERTPLTLAIKSCVIDFICFILEADFYSSKKIHDKFADKTRAYKLLCARESFGNIKTIIAWLEDTIKLYDKCNNSDNSSFLRVQHGHHHYLVIESLQKLLAFSMCASDKPKELADIISREVVFAHNRLNDYTQQHLLITGIKSNDLLMVTAKELLPEIPIDVAEEYYSYPSCNWDQIINYYFKMFSLANIEKWGKCDLLRNTFYFLLLLQSYIEGSHNDLHDGYDRLAMTDELADFQRQIETFLNNVPDEITFLFCLIKLSIVL